MKCSLELAFSKKREQWGEQRREGLLPESGWWRSGAFSFWLKGDKNLEEL